MLERCIQRGQRSVKTHPESNSHRSAVCLHLPRPTKVDQLSLHIQIVLALCSQQFLPLMRAIQQHQFIQKDLMIVPTFSDQLQRVSIPTARGQSQLRDWVSPLPRVMLKLVPNLNPLDTSLSMDQRRYPSLNILLDGHLVLKHLPQSTLQETPPRRSDLTQNIVLTRPKSTGQSQSPGQHTAIQHTVLGHPTTHPHLPAR